MLVVIASSNMPFILSSTPVFMYFRTAPFEYKQFVETGLSRHQGLQQQRLHRWISAVSRVSVLLRQITSCSCRSAGSVTTFPSVRVIDI